MRQDYEQLFRSLAPVEPPPRLSGNIFVGIGRRKRRAARIRLALQGTVSLASLVATVPAFRYAALEFSESGFHRYLSLLFSDGAVVLASWKEFAMSLAESLPLVGATLFLSSVFVLLWSLKLAAKNARTAFMPRQFAS